MSIETIFKTSDGKVFETFEEAESRESELSKENQKSLELKEKFNNLCPTIRGRLAKLLSLWGLEDDWGIIEDQDSSLSELERFLDGSMEFPKRYYDNYTDRSFDTIKDVIADVMKDQKKDKHDPLLIEERLFCIYDLDATECDDAIVQFEIGVNVNVKVKGLK